MITYNKVTIEDLDVAGKRVLVRCDFNVPMKEGKITNDNRIVAALPTIKYLMDKGGRLILCSHLGKPKNGPEEKFSLAPVAVRLSELLGKTVVFANDDNVVGDNAKAAVAAMKDGDVVLLQNTRFRKEETKNIEDFSKDLASLCDVYVDDAFGSCHRAHCSTAGVTDYVKETAVGYLMQKEIKYLGNAVEDPQRPFLAILGGAKVADKLSVIENLLNKVDTLIIGGGMAYTFLKAKLRGGHLPGGRGEDRLLRRHAEEGGGEEGQAAAPHRHRHHRRFPRPHRRAGGDPCRGLRQDPRRYDGPGYRPQDPGAVRQGRQGGQDRCLERAYGGL